MKTDRSHKDIRSLKKSLRKSIQKQRDSLSEKTRHEKSLLISSKFTGCDYYRDSKRLLAYYPFRSEIDTSIIIKEALAHGKEVALPRVNNDQLDIYYIKDISKDLMPGSYDIMEPVPDRCLPACPEEIDLVIVPGVGFDRELNRLGYGGGFYDRFLEKIPPCAVKIALAFDMQIVDNVPVSGHDFRVDMLITELSIYKA